MKRDAHGFSLRRMRSFLLMAACACCAQLPVDGQQQHSIVAGNELQFVVIISRHGVRSPTGKTDQLNRYSRQPWPSWSVPPGNLTEHGAQLMKIFGSYYREKLAAQGLFGANGCADASHVRIIADSDQRTRETGKSLAAGLAPGCDVQVSALPEGTADPLFHSLEAGVGQPDKLLATAAVSGRIGGDPRGLSEAFRPQLEALEDVLHACKPGADCTNAASPAPQSLFDIPSSIGPGEADHLVQLRSPLGIAATMAEDLLLEYTEGMDVTNVGWGRVDVHLLREFLQLHTANEEITARTRYLARLESSNLLFHVLQSMEASVRQQAVTGALTNPGDRLLILVGHDTNLANIGGDLNLSWLVDGRIDDTPPGGALIFELWKGLGTRRYSVRAFYTAQTLDQMRNSTPLSAANPPDRVPIFIPGCGQADGSCEWAAFQQTMREAIDPAFVK